MNELINVNKLKIPRNYCKKLLTSKNIQLHMFTDASERAFASVPYVRIEVCEAFQVALISAKSKVPSLKSNNVLSIPRFELQGALLGVRLANMIQKEHSVKFQSVTFWSDSQTVISWIKTEYGSFKPFVAHRIAEILVSTTGSQWRYISSKINPADEATKTTKSDPFDFNSIWFQGPQFLSKPEHNWPVYSKVTTINKDDSEVRRIFVMEEIKNKMIRRKMDYSPIDPNKFSNWHELKRITAWAKRGLYNWSKRLQNQQPQ